MRSLPYAYQAPAFSMIPVSAAMSTSSDSWLIPSSNMMSNSAWRNGGGTFLFYNFMQAGLPVNNSHSLSRPIGLLLVRYHAVKSVLHPSHLHSSVPRNSPNLSFRM